MYSIDLFKVSPTAIVDELPPGSDTVVFTVWEGEGYTFIELRDKTLVLIAEPSSQENS